MLRVKLIPILLPVVAGAAFLWYRSRKKSKGLPVEDAEGWLILKKNKLVAALKFVADLNERMTI